MRLSPSPLHVITALVALAASAPAEIKLPAVLSDHMVLQRESEVALWGWAAPDAKVEIRGDFLAQPVSCSANAQGAFRARVKTLGAGGPHTLEFREGGAGAAKAIADIWFGEVWLCGGQSNMEMPIAPVDGYTGVRDWQKELESADLPQLRYFDVRNTAAAGPASDCAGQWVVSTRASAQHFSATGYFFAREIQRELKVPVGLVGVNWGGTPAQAWTSGAALAKFPEYGKDLARMAEVQRDPEGAKRKLAADLAAWIAALGEAPNDRAGWKTMEQPGIWSGELAQFDGVLFLARRVEVPASPSRRWSRRWPLLRSISENRAGSGDGGRDKRTYA
jgi:sialate O-acetylesterase